MHIPNGAASELREIRHFHLFCGLGDGARGFNRGSARVGGMQAIFRCIGGIDSSAAAIRDFDRMAGVRGTVLDLFDTAQYTAFHGRPPPPDWCEATPAHIQAAAGGECPHIVFLSAPCKGFSGLLPETLSLTDKYQALNKLTLRGMWLTLEAWQDDPPELIVFENVPRIVRRGRALLDRISRMLRHYGYAVAETTHDCGELGGLAQTRKRFLLVARHQAKVPPFLYEPPKRPLRAVGDVLGRMPLAGDIEAAGPMHRVPELQWQTWVRLAFVEAGADWRSLSRLTVNDGHLADFRIMPESPLHNGTLGVRAWSDTAGTVTANGRPGTGAFSVADPRRQADRAAFGQYGVNAWTASSQTIIGKAAVGAGGFAVADPRHGGPAKFSNVYRVVEWDEPSAAVTSSRDVAVADPRGGAGSTTTTASSRGEKRRKRSRASTARATAPCASPTLAPDGQTTPTRRSSAFIPTISRFTPSPAQIASRAAPCVWPILGPACSARRATIGSAPATTASLPVRRARTRSAVRPVTTTDAGASPIHASAKR